MSASRQHIPEEQLVAFADKALVGPEADRVADHVAQCAQCAQTVASVRNVRGMLRGYLPQSPTESTIVRAEGIFKNLRQAAKAHTTSPRQGSSRGDVRGLAATASPDANIALLGSDFSRRQGEWSSAGAPASRALSAFRRLLTAIVVLLVVAFGVFLGFESDAALIAVDQTIPGDLFYPVKTAVDGVRLTWLQDSVSKSEFRVVLVQKRFEEILALIASQRFDRIQGASVALENEIRRAGDEIDAANRSDPVRGRMLAAKLSGLLSNNQTGLSRAMAQVPNPAKPPLEHVLVIIREEQARLSQILSIQPVAPPSGSPVRPRAPAPIG